MERKFHTAKNRSDLESFFPVMKELRPHLTLESYLEIYEEAHRQDGYEIVALKEGHQVLALMGYRFLSDFVRGRHLYIDDLVSSESFRSKGLGAELLKHAEVIASLKDCKVLRLCTGTENNRGVQFYEKNGWLRRAFAYNKKI